MAVGILLLYGKEMFTKNIDLRECKPLLHFGIATIFTSFGVMTLDWADRIIIERYMSFADVGLYSAANRVSGLMGVLLIVPFTQIWSPMMFEYKKNPEIKKITSKVLSYFLMVGAISLTLMALFSAEILHFLIKYEVTQLLILVFLILSLASLINGTANIVVAWIFYERKVYLMPFIYAAIAGIKIVLNVSLIPIFGISAAAFNTLIASILVPCAIYFFSKRYFIFEIEWYRIGKIAVLASIPVGYCILIQSHSRSIENFGSQLLLTIIIFLAIYKICLYSVEKIYIENMFKKFQIDFLTND
jgi:O-antigen/teichoic acid export membrane protein